MRNKPLSQKFVASVVCLLAFGVPDAALAYIGPGAGITAIGTVIALFAAVLLALIGFVFYPIKRLLKGRGRGGKVPQQ